MKKLIIITFLILLLSSLTISQPISVSRDWAISNTKEVISLTDKDILIEDSKNMSISTGKSKIEITSTSNRYTVGDFSKTGEWAYPDDVEETLKSDELFISRNYVCNKNDFMVIGEGLSREVDYKNCVYYPEQYENITLSRINNKTLKLEYYDEPVNVRNLTQIDKRTVVMEANAGYDPTSTGLTVGIVAYWNMDADADDQVGVNDGSVTGAIQVGGILGNSYSFDGDDTIITTDNNFGNGYAASTINIWFKTNHTTPITAFLAGKNNGADNAYQLMRVNNNALWFIHGSVDIRYPTPVAGNFPDYDDGVWHMVTHIYNGTHFLGYVDNVLVGTPTALTGVARSYTQKFNIGTSGTSNYWIGELDEVGAWNRALNATELTDLYNGGVGWAYPFTIPPTQPPTPTADLINLSQNNESVYLNASNVCAAKCYIYQDGVNVNKIASFPFNRTNVTNNTAYSFNFTVYNDTYDIPESNFSNTITVSTLQNPPSQTPTPTADLLNISQNNESVYLNASSDCDDKCLLYQDGTNVVNISSFPYNRTGLTNGTSYSFNFTVYNITFGIPESNFSNTITTTTDQNVKGPSPNISVVWNSPLTNANHTNQTFVIYQINVTCVNGPCHINASLDPKRWKI